MHNRDQVPATHLAWPICVALVGTALIHGVLSGVMSDRNRAGALTSLSVLSFSYYAHLLDWARAPLLRALLWLVVLLLVGVRLQKLNAFDPRFTRLLNRAGTCLLVIALGSGLWSELRAEAGEKTSPSLAGVGSTPEEEFLTLRDGQDDRPLPHIFYIMLDAYGGSSALKTFYGLDNTEFYRGLESRGFDVLEGTHANFPHTTLALSAVLNLDYPWNVLRQSHPRSREVYESLRRPRLLRVLERAGYTTVAFPRPTHLTEIEPQITLGGAHGWLPNRFSRLLLTSTPVPEWLQLMGEDLPAGLVVRARNLDLLEQTPGFASARKPHFVLVHLMAPHNPFFFEADGSLASDWDVYQFERWVEGFDRTEMTDEDLVVAFRERYAEQVLGLNARLLSMIDVIRRRSSRPLLIILQSDHGPRPQYITAREKRFVREGMTRERAAEWYPNLTAVLEPEGFTAGFYDGMTPVNTFRLILGELLRQPLERVPDRSYYPVNPGGLHFEFVDVTAKLERRPVAGDFEEARVRKDTDR